MNLTHVIKEATSAPEDLLWEMWCGANCIALPDGTLIPELDFYGELWAEKATCAVCKARLRGVNPTVAAEMEIA